VSLHLLAAMALVACGNESARAPNPTGYAWPTAWSYRVDLATQSERDTAVLGRFEEHKVLRLAQRDGRFLIWHDSVIKLSRAAGAPAQLEPYWPEDTLQYHLELGRLGELGRAEPGCDPVLPACREALTWTLPLELRHLVPKLPVWWPPKGYQWEDTLRFDDRPRSRGARGTVVTRYRAARDTVIGRDAFWIVELRSVRQSWPSAPGSAASEPEPPVRESGIVFVDKGRLLPAYAAWAGEVAAPPEISRLGVTGTGFRGRAILVGSLFDSLLARR
jgi:hypothetical protein